MASTVDIIAQVTASIAPLGMGERQIAFAIDQLMDSALSDLSVDVGRDSVRRNLLRTNPATATLTFTNGQAVLTGLQSSNAILVELFRTAELMQAATSDYPFQWCAGRSQGALKSRTDGMFVKIWMEGFTLFTKDLLGAFDGITGTVNVAASFTPTLAQLPDELITDLVEMVAEMIRKEPVRFIDPPEPGGIR